ncbi:MAG: hypothetical protein B7X08_02800 [Acidocella sp. 20-63-7]|nr:MAG: hypothetical protein B7X08_02800 [Acidocella sp. 20-63-7]HQT46166.1 glycosyltransferase family 87 protein [Acidocella sp.]
MGLRTGFLRLVCYPVILVSTLLAITFDWAAHRSDVLRHHGEGFGDFLIFRANAILTTHAHALTTPAAAFLPYPPPFLLCTMPLSWLAPATGFTIWVLTSSIGLVLVARAIKLPWPAIGLGFITQPDLFCLIMGQSGTLVSVFLLAALGLAEVQPILAGVAAGAIVIKPQFGLLIPVCYLATRKWRATTVAAATVAGLCLLTTLCFGMGVWHSFATKHVAGAQNLMTAHWPAKFQIMMVTPFVLLRSLSADLGVASLIQGGISLVAAIGCWHIWRRQGLSTVGRLAPTLCLVALATPYASIYDLPALGMALAGLAFELPRRGLIALTLLFVFSAFYAVLSVYYFSTGALFLAVILLLVWPYSAPALPRVGDFGDLMLHRGQQG